MKDSAASTAVLQLADIGLAPLLGGIALGDFAQMRHQPQCEAMQLVEHECSQGCGTKLLTAAFFAPLTCCEPCKAKALEEDRIAKARLYWEATCPPSFRDTDTNHPSWPKAQYAATRNWKGEESLLLYGPTGVGKTRLAMWLIKRCLLQNNSHVGVIWPYELKAVRHEREIINWVKKWGRYDVLLLDDPLQGAADSRITDALKDLIAYRQDWKRPCIFTSQIGGDDYEQQAAKFGKETNADKEVIAALMRRIRETCKVISFTEAKPTTAEEEAF